MDTTIFTLKNGIEATIRHLDTSDFQALRQLHHRICELVDPDYLAVRSDDILMNYLNPETGVATGGFINNEMVSYCMNYRLTSIPDDRGYIFNFPVDLSNNKILRSTGVAVHEDYQGLGLACPMLESMITPAYDRGYDLIIGRTARQNAVSLKLTERLGGRLACITENGNSYWVVCDVNTVYAQRHTAPVDLEIGN